MIVDPALKQWASERQITYIDLANQLGSMRAVAREMGLSDDAPRMSIASLIKKARLQGYAPDFDLNNPVPEPFSLTGYSTYYKATPTSPAQWIKTSIRQQEWEAAIREGVKAFLADVGPIPAPTSSGITKDTFRYFDVIPWFQIGDAHLGMIAYESETGANFDINIAEREICAAMSILIDETPATERCVIQDCGDFTHYENMAGVTSHGGNVLDCDGRIHKMIKAYSRIMRFLVDKALAKFEFVDVIVNQGNHSRVNDFWMSELLRVAYGHTDRVSVLNNDSVFMVYRMGKTMVLCHHSDKCKPQALAHVMSTDYAEDWGETLFRFIDIGHIHHNMVSKEHPGCQVESWNQLAPPDKWAFEAGYRSRQCLTVVERSRCYGETARRRLGIERVRDLMIAAANDNVYVPPKRAVFAV